MPLRLRAVFGATRILVDGEGIIGLTQCVSGFIAQRITIDMNHLEHLCVFGEPIN